MSDQYMFGTGFEDLLNDDYWMEFMQPDTWAYTTTCFQYGIEATHEPNALTAVSSQLPDLDFLQDASAPVADSQPNPISGIEGVRWANIDDNHGQDAVVSSKYTPRIAYPKKTCATCHAPLDLSQQHANFENPSLFCTEIVASDHPSLACNHEGCDEVFSSIKDLKSHSAKYFHESFWCTSNGCEARLSSRIPSINQHYENFHPTVLVACAECNAQFESRSLLDMHGMAQGHEAHICQFPGCDSKAAQMGDLIRHQLSHQKIVKRHACKYCRKFRGNQGFKRRDHLLQHVRNYHHIETAISKNAKRPFCQECRVEFFKLEDCTTHFLEKHQSKPYTCRRDQCDRVGMNGFETEESFKAHMKTDHLPEHPCVYPGCDRAGMKGYAVNWALVKHVKKVHKAEEVEDI